MKYGKRHNTNFIRWIMMISRSNMLHCKLVPFYIDCITSSLFPIPFLEKPKSGIPPKTNPLRQRSIQAPQISSQCSSKRVWLIQLWGAHQSSVQRSGNSTNLERVLFWAVYASFKGSRTHVWPFSEESGSRWFWENPRNSNSNLG